MFQMQSSLFRRNAQEQKQKSKVRALAEMSRHAHVEPNMQTPKLNIFIHGSYASHTAPENVKKNFQTK